MLPNITQHGFRFVPIPCVVVPVHNRAKVGSTMTCPSDDPREVDSFP